MNIGIGYEPTRDLGRITYADADAPPGVDLAEHFRQEIQFQNGPVGINGVNGVQNEDVLNLLLVRMRDLNTKFPCRENSLAITKMEEALFWLEHRTKLRREQGVEGHNLAHAS